MVAHFFNASPWEFYKILGRSEFKASLVYSELQDWKTAINTLTSTKPATQENKEGRQLNEKSER